MKHSMILIAVLTAAALIAMVATRQLAVKQQAPQTERAETTQPAGIQTEVAIVKEGNTASLEIAMLPRQTDVSVSTFALDLLITDKAGDGITTVGKISPDQMMTSSFWSFPIFTATTEDEGLVVKISGVHVATAPYQLTDHQVIATIPVDPSVEPDDLVVTLGTEHTKFLTKDAMPIPVDENVVVK